jgi:hypothetical protein
MSIYGVTSANRKRGRKFEGFFVFFLIFEKPWRSGHDGILLLLFLSFDT